MTAHNDAACALLAEPTFASEAMVPNDIIDPDSASTLLHYAAKHNMAQTITALLKHKTDVSVKVCFVFPEGSKRQCSVVLCMLCGE
jgi:hypothetical protein